jgi:hypothetical protein
MGKRLVVALLAGKQSESFTEIHGQYATSLTESECKNIRTSLGNRRPSQQDVNNAICVLIADFYASGGYALNVDITKFDRTFAPLKEMTVAEIEKELGHKVKIVEEKEE